MRLVVRLQPRHARPGVLAAGGAARLAVDGSDGSDRIAREDPGCL